MSNVEAQFAEYVRVLMLRQHQWADAHRQEMPQKDHTNNIVEAAFRVLKDNVRSRTRAFNVSHLLEFIGERLDWYYCRRLLDATHGALSGSCPLYLSLSAR